MAKSSKKDGREDAGRGLAIVETRGMIAALEASDAMVKSADVQMTGLHKLQAGLITVTARGDIGAVQTAAAAGAAAAEKIGELIGSHVIARPHDDVEKIVADTRDV